MNSSTRIALLALSLALAPFASHAQTANTTSNPAVAALVASIRAVPSDQREELIRATITSNPSLAPALVAALVSGFPSDAPLLTRFVVQSLLGLTSITTETKSQLLTAVAQSAVTAALQIPSTAVPDLRATVNDVKSSLANVPTEFEPSVAEYITPLPPGTVFTPSTNFITNETIPTNIIVSDDTP